MKNYKYLKNYFFLLFALVILIIFINFKPSYANTEKNNFLDVGLKFGPGSVKELNLKVEGLALSNGEKNIMISSEKEFIIKAVPIYIKNENFRSISQEGISTKPNDFVFSDDLNVFKTASLSKEYDSRIADAICIFNNKNQPIFAIKGNSNIFLSSQGFAPFEVLGKKYRGFLKLINNNSFLTVINHVHMEDYLKGVISKEMPASWNIEALKAQAVAARSYAYRNSNKFQNFGFGLTDDTRCQVYAGVNGETPNTNLAVEETTKVVGIYNGKIADLIFTSSNGGKMESSKNIWGGDVPYLVAKDDPFSLNNPYSNWSFQLTKSDIENYLKSSKVNIGDLLDVKIDTKSNSGYVLSITFNGTNGNKTYKGDYIRNLFGYNKLKSLLFTVNSNNSNNSNYKEFNILDEFINSKNSKNNNNGNQKIYTFTGSGYGHGVGLSQFGANEMAKRGYNYLQILSFYYPGVQFTVKDI